MIDSEEESEGFEVAQSTKRKPPSWRKVLVGLFFTVVGIAGVMSFYSDDLITPVEEHLKALRENRITEAYYRYTAHEFQDGTSLPSFREFVSTHPILHQNQSFEYDDSHIQGSLGLLHGRVIGQDGSVAPVQYRLKREGERWRILTIKLAPAKKIKHEDHSRYATDLPQLIKRQLSALRRKDITAAYEDVASKEFKNKTSLREFKKFVERYPVLFDHHNVIVKAQSEGASEGHVQVELVAEEKLYDVNYKVIKEDGVWKIWNMRLSVPIAHESNTIQTNRKVFERPILDQIHLIKKKDYENAYHGSVTTDFKKVTPFKVFEDFVHAFPVLTEHQSMEMGELVMDDDDTGVMQVDFYSPGGVTVIEYTLAEEDGEWKILGLKVLQHNQFDPANTTAEDTTATSVFDTESLAAVIQEQIQAVKTGMISDAYHQYTAKGFREATSFETFDQFMRRHPAFANNKTGKFTNLTFNNNVGTLIGTLVTKSGTRYPVEYDLVLEDGKWKVLHVEVHPASDHLADNHDSNFDTESRVDQDMEPKIEKIAVGSEVDIYGIVKDPHTIFDADSKELYVNVTVGDAKEGTIIELFFTHLNSGSVIQPVSTTINKDGRSVVSFVYSSPPKGWPKGNYQLRAKTSTDQERKYNFKIK